MVIAVRTESGRIISRPETTCDRPEEDFYAPEYVNSLSYTPVFFVRVSRPGRSVAPRFAGRYFNACGFGLFLYPEDMLDSSPESLACASCLDHTSFIRNSRSMEEFSPETEFTISFGDKTIFTGTAPPLEETARALALSSSRIHLRTGDFVAIELAPPEHLCDRPTSARLSAKSGNDIILDINIYMNSL